MHDRLFEYEDHWLVHRKDSPNYHIYWCRKGTRRVRRKSTGTDDLEEAKRRLITFVNARQRPRDKAPDSVAVMDALADYCERTVDGKPFWPAAKTALKYFTAFFEQHDVVYVSEITLDLQETYIAWRRDMLLKKQGSASNATINRELGVLRAALRAFWKRGYLTTVPYIQLLPSPPPRERFLHAHEVRSLLDACWEDHLRLYVMLALHTLQRPIAIYALRTEQVDLAWNRINFHPPGQVETNKRYPVVPITRSLRSMLEEAVATSETGFVLEYLGRPVRCVKRSFKQACNHAELENVTPYVLRHTGATLLAAHGVPLRQIAGMLGHTEQKTTEIYAKHAPEFLKDAADALDELFGAREQK